MKYRGVLKEIKKQGPFPSGKRSHPGKRAHPGKRSLGYAAVLAVVALLAAACGPRGVPRISPPPAQISSMSGHGSLLLAGVDRGLKGKFAFLLDRDGRARIDAFDPLGRTASTLIFAGDAAVLAVPSRRVYWRTSPADLMDRFLGFPLALGDVWRLLTGRWDDRISSSDEGVSRLPWETARDATGRVIAGRRGTLGFTIQSFFPGTAVARKVSFEDTTSTGRITILDLTFNPPARPEAFDTGFLKHFQEVDWNEIEKLLQQ